ncbi:extracellular metalloprotease [Tuber borchii]|uniref:Extracellular metalloprotease n=1 Tax=Tuber borchii TaxID=42251 RepID=A0A2T6ZQQ2_TUBBO|nr:extracellular metalloprotease [Tuber borchii]
MKFSFSLIFSLAVFATARKCGTPEPSQEHLEASQTFAQGAADVENNRQATEAAPITISVWFHVLRAGTLVSQGNIPDSQITAQLDVMNNDYTSTRFKFTLAGITRTTNPSWFYEYDTGSMRAALRRGDYKTLNLYSQNLTNDNFGYCNFPNKPTASVIQDDGCAIHYDTTPGGSIENYNLGRTATHETGHWLGLYHTFEGGCTGGDYISDTPAIKTPTKGCPAGKNTCTGPSYPGDDPIHNFMDWSYDACMTEFTPGQATRMVQMWKKYRA